jgi:predicted transcriptional regulator
VSDKHRAGRPLKHHAAGTLVTMGLQVPAELKNRLQDKAMAFNRSLSQEIQRRLERSFSIQALQEDAIAMAVEEANARFSEQLAKEVADIQAAAAKQAERLGINLKQQWGDVLADLRKSTTEVQEQIDRLQGRSRTK